MGQKIFLSWLILFSWQLIFSGIIFSEEHNHKNCLCQLSQSLCHHPGKEKKDSVSVKNSVFCKCPSKTFTQVEQQNLFYVEKPIITCFIQEQSFELSVLNFYKNPELFSFYPPS